MNDSLTDLRCPVLAALPDEIRRSLLEYAVPRALARGEALLLAGSPPQRVYVVRRGLVKLAARDSEGRVTILGLALPGGLVGELAAADGLAQPLDALAATRAEVVSLGAQRFVDAVSASPAAALALMRVQADRMRRVCETALERSSAAISERLAARLLDLADLLGRRDGDAIEFEVPLAQADIAGIAGMCRESACKAIGRLRAQGVLEYRGRRLRILRPDALERLSCARRGAAPCRSAGAAGARRPRPTWGT